MPAIELTQTHRLTHQDGLVCQTCLDVGKLTGEVEVRARWGSKEELGFVQMARSHPLILMKSY